MTPSAPQPSNDDAIARWNDIPRTALDAMGPDGDFAKRHLINPVLLRMLGDVRESRILDAGSGTGYLSRLLAARGARVTAVEPTGTMYAYACEQEAAQPRGVTYVRADITQLPPLEGEFDAVVCSMVLSTVPDWKPALRACADALRPGGQLIFTVNHPAFEQLLAPWRTHGAYRLTRYLEEYEIPQTHAPDYHRPLSAYLKELPPLGLHFTELAEPGLPPAVAEEAAPATPGIESYVHLTNFVVVAARKALRD
ncbi:class I SAM-dependent methyltransferase [Streptomyces spiroverticillatus]|uniref:Class I SAM-dependent methyltransferase n=1 Tax=Streptomyces finlayi TaxID=67296 RepID=A0A918WTQ0_9ACTN|nr:class I SAM-dependent methyltransferase [Streptomyces finlayi]GGZ97010.1 class I SAM-dependent methyltransferase [Streptomyces spiroverticillatus]GHC82237.1 class I SAM-dependent methyltransferase [Streptomyces finlayi]